MLPIQFRGLAQRVRRLLRGSAAPPLLAATLATGCNKAPYVPPEGIPDLFRATQAAPALDESALDGCVTLHHVWKAEVRAVHRTAGGTTKDRVRMLTDSAYTPYRDFWDGYVSGFPRWAGRHLDLAGDPRRAIPMQVDLLDAIAGPTARAAELTGRLGCAEWYLVYGPGWTNLGGLSDGRMILDFFGLPKENGLADIRMTVPHEIGHIIRGRARRAAPAGSQQFTVLESIVSEGFASYFADWYWGDEMTPAEALGYTDEQWAWALAHERELWAIAANERDDTDRNVIDRYRTASAHLVPDGPPKVGYFLGYRIIQAYVASHGDASMQALMGLPGREILETSGYAPH